MLLLNKFTISCLLSLSLFCNYNLIYALATSAPPSLGGTTSSKTKISSSSAPIKVEERNDDVTKKSKKVLSKREQQEAKAGRLSRSEIETEQITTQFSASLDKEIGYVEKLLPTLSKTTEQRPDVLRRLIESYHQKALLTFLEENKRYDQAWIKWDKGGRNGNEPGLNNTASQAWTSKVIQKAMLFTTEYPKHQRVDIAYFQIAFALESLGKRDDAAKYYTQIVQKFPNSKRVPDSHFALGEYYFDKQDFKKSLSSFQEVLRFTKAQIYPWALYKIAWCYYNLLDYRNALGAFQNVVRLSQTSTNMSAAGKLRLKEEALREMVSVYAELNDVAGAERYFSTIGADKYFADLLIKLADILREKGEYEGSVNVLKRFINRNPYNLKAAEIQIQIVDTSNKIQDGEKRIFWAEYTTLVSNYKPGSAWAQKNSQDKDLKELQERVNKVSITIPKNMHALAQKLNNKNGFKDAKKGYNIYLLHFGSRPESIEVRFFLAELEYQDNNYPEALKHFWGVAQLKEKTPYFAKAGEYVVSSSYLPAEPEIKKLKAEKVNPKAKTMPLTPTLNNYIKACDAYISWFPKDKKIIDCQVDTADIYLKTNNYPEAEKRLLVIAKTYPDRKEGLLAADVLLWIAANSSTGDDASKKVMKMAMELSKYPQYQTGEVGKKLAKIKESTRFQAAADSEKSNKFHDAAVEYEKLATENPNGDDADKAMYNAGVNYRKAAEGNKAMDCFTRVYQSYPKSLVAPNAILAIAEMSEDRLILDKAADAGLLFLQRYPQNPKAQTVAVTACFLYDALNNVAKAAEICTKVINFKNKDSSEATLTLADLYHKNRRYNEFLQLVDSTILKLGINDSDKLEYLAKSADAERKLGKASNARQREEQMNKIYSSNPRAIQGLGLSEVARLEFEKQMPVYQKFNSIRLESRDAASLQASVVQKQNALAQVESALQKVIIIKDPEWTVASAYIIGRAYESFAYDLSNPPLPAGMGPDVQKNVKEGFAKLAKPPREKAKTYFTEAMKAVNSAAVYSDYSQKTAEALARVNPKEYQKIEEWLPDALYVGSQWMEIASVKKAIDVLGGGR